MKANELRIGNIITDGVFEITVTEIEDGLIKGTTRDRVSQTYSFNIENIEGVSLTEEWLLKLGFEKLSAIHFEFGKYFWFELHIDQSTVLKTKNGEGISVHYNDGDENNCIPFDNCKTAHQLQNLYFALTGEELTIKL